MNKAKAMLDALMGPNRDADPSSKSEDWKDKRVCKHFLVGLCPRDKGVIGGRRSIEVCTKIHNEMLRESFNVHADGGPDSKFRRECEAELQQVIKELISKKDAYAKEQLSLKNAELKIRTTGPNPEVGRMKREAMEFKDKAEALPADEVMEKERLMEAHKKAMEEYEAFRNDFEKKLETSAKAQACKVCGLAYSTDEEYEAHAPRKMHVAYSQVLQKMEELEKKQSEWEEKKKSEREKTKGEREDKKSRSRDKKAKAGERSKSRAGEAERAKDDDGKEAKEAKQKKADDAKDDDAKEAKKKKSDDAKDDDAKEAKKKKTDADDDGKNGKKVKKRSSSRDKKKSKADSRSRSRDRKRRNRSRSRDRRRSRSRSRDRRRSRSRSKDRRR